LAYTILVRDLLSSLVEGWILGDGALSWLEKNVVSTIACGMIAPACFIKHLTEVRVSHAAKTHA
jgi:amino acid permease